MELIPCEGDSYLCEACAAAALDLAPPTPAHDEGASADLAAEPEPPEG